jgi:multiple antibiotic resistance protein
MYPQSLLNDLLHFGSIVLLALGAVLPIVDPLGGAPIFLSMTTDLSSAERGRLAWKVAINSFVLLIASTLIGAYVLDFFGVSIPAVQVAGGAVVFMLGWSLLHSTDTPHSLDHSRELPPTRPDPNASAFYPLTMPLTVGPGSLSIALTLGANPPQGLRPLLLTTIAHAVGMLLVCILVYLCYRYADRLATKLGTTGTSVVLRLTAFIMLCIGVQIAWNGIHALITSGFPTLAR